MVAQRYDNRPRGAVPGRAGPGPAAWPGTAGHQEAAGGMGASVNWRQSTGGVCRRGSRLMCMRGVAAGQRRIGDPRVMDRAAQTAPAPAAPRAAAAAARGSGPAAPATSRVRGAGRSPGWPGRLRRSRPGPVPVLGHQRQRRLEGRVRRGIHLPGQPRVPDSNRAVADVAADLESAASRLSRGLRRQSAIDLAAPAGLATGSVLVANDRRTVPLPLAEGVARQNTSTGQHPQAPERPPRARFAPQTAAQIDPVLMTSSRPSASGWATS